MINKIVYNFSMFGNECSPLCLLFDFLLNCVVYKPNDCGCTSGTDSEQDGREWTLVGTKETKHIGTKIRTTNTRVVQVNRGLLL